MHHESVPASTSMRSAYLRRRYCSFCRVLTCRLQAPQRRRKGMWRSRKQQRGDSPHLTTPYHVCGSIVMPDHLFQHRQAGTSVVPLVPAALGLQICF